MKVLVMGATGGTGHCVVELALQAGHEVTALARTPHKIRLQHERLRVVQGDVLHADAVLRAMQGQQAVICALGPAAGTAPGTIISKGARNIIQAMKQERVRRLVFQSGMMVGDGPGLSAFNRILLGIFRKLNRALYEDKVRAEKLVRQSGLEWIIVRPPKLKHMPGRGNYRVGSALNLSLPAGLAHADVADFMVRSASSDVNLHQLLEIGY